MVRFDLLRALTADGEALLRMRAAEHARDPEEMLLQVHRALDDRRLSAVCLYDDAGKARGLAAWRWPNGTRVHAQVIVQYVQPVAPPALGEMLVDYVFSELYQSPELEVVEGRLRDTSPGVRPGWQKRDAAFFERCRMARALGHVPVPFVPIPDGYRVVAWDSRYLAQIGQVARAAYADSIERIAVPELDGENVAETLRRLRAGVQVAGGTWHQDASLVAINGRDEAVGYVVAAIEDGTMFVADVAVHPHHQRRGLGRLLIARATAACQAQDIQGVEWAVTTRNPARSGQPKASRRSGALAWP